MTTPAWLALARADTGVHEYPGAARDHPTIIGYFQNVGTPWFEHDEVPWCAAAMGSWFKDCGIAIPAANEVARARAWADWGERLDKPKPGAVMVLRRGSDPSKGHVTLFERDLGGGRFMGLGGNQGNAVDSDPFKHADVIAIRWPKRPANVPPANVPAEVVSTITKSGTLWGVIVSSVSAGLLWLYQTAVASVEYLDGLKPLIEAAAGMGVDPVASFVGAAVFGAVLAGMRRLKATAEGKIG